MTNKILIMFVSCILSDCSLYGWGPEGHAIVGRLALHFVADDVRNNVTHLLDGMSMDTAANWMDILKSNPEYDFMRTWHYVDYDKGTEYRPTNKENIINRLQLTYNELKHRNLLCDEQVRMDLLVMLHLMGDLHMPLHTGYEEDLGGNKRIVNYDTLKTHNLHQFWDEDIIQIGRITDSDCLCHYEKALLDSNYLVDFVAWMSDSRLLLDNVYDFPDYRLDDNYLVKNKIVVEKQLLKAGIRLALVLNRLFSSPAQLLNYSEEISVCRNSIPLDNAIDYLGKKVSICGRVNFASVSPTIARISIGSINSKAAITIVIFKNSYSKFKIPIDEMFKGKSVLVRGKMEEYQGKPQLVIEDPLDIEIL